jgi:hypothetical protein
MKLAEIKNQGENEAVKKAVMSAKPVQWPYYWLGITGKLGNTYIFIYIHIYIYIYKITVEHMQNLIVYHPL